MNVLSSASAFNPGSDLWIVPDHSQCRWTQKIDWHLNFQIIKKQRHLSQELPNFTKLIQHETGLESFEYRVSKTAPLMIASESFFPNKWVVVVPIPQFDLWVQQAYIIWKNLQQPSLRVFLPTGQNTGSFYSEWQKHHNFEDFTVVLD